MRLKNFPISFFAPILGLGGLTIVLQKFEEMFSFSLFSNYLLRFTIGILAVLTIAYLLKIIYFPKEVKKEFYHPIRINFFPTFPKSLLILSIAFLTISIATAKVLWIVGAGMNLVFTLWIFSVYINKEFEVKHINPSRFIPIVTNIVVPITGIAVFPQYPEISRFFFSIGLIFWMIIFFMFMYRIIFHHPLTEKLLPTMVILIAPPAIAFISYYKLTGTLDAFAMIMFYLSLFLFLLLLVDSWKFTKIKFYLSRRAYSFPLAAFTLANILMYHISEQAFFKYLSIVVTGFLIALIVLLAIKTVQSIKKKELCIEEE